MFKDKKHLAIPPIPPEILSAIPEEKLVLFVGAGVSKLFGYKLWMELGQELVETCVQEGCLTRSDQSEILSRGYGPMEGVTIAIKKLNELSSNSGTKKLIEFLQATPKGKTSAENRVLLPELLASFKCPIITTNADLTLDHSRPFKKEPILKSFNEWDNNDQQRRGIIHIHGSINDPENLIFTADQYAAAYSYGRPIAKNLPTLFENKTILFVGYSMREFELIRYFFTSTEKNENTRNLFMLEGYLEKDDIKYELDEAYFNTLKICVLPYSREEKGYEALIEVLQKWVEDIRRLTTIASNDLRTLRDIAQRQPAKNRIKSIQSLLSDKGSYMVVRELSDSPYICEYIIALKFTNRLFSSKKYLQPCIVNDDGSYRSSTWEGLNLIKACYDRGKNNNEVDGFVEKLLDRCIKIYRADEAINNPYQKASSSHSIIETLISITSSNQTLSNKHRLKKLIDYYLSSPGPRGYFIAHVLLKAQNVLINDPKEAFEIYKSFYERCEIDSASAELLKGININQIVKRKPSSFYAFSKRKLEECQADFFTMGSFLDYGEGRFTYHEKSSVIADWLRQSSIFLQDPKILNNDINQFIHSDVFYLEKAGLCLINLNFDTSETIFYQNLEFICNKREFYLDLLGIVKRHGNALLKSKKFIKTIESASFEEINESRRLLLLNRLHQLLNQQGGSFICTEEGEKEKEYIENYGKIAYSVSVRDEDYKIPMLKEMGNSSIEQAIGVYEKYCRSGVFFQHIAQENLAEFIESFATEPIRQYFRQLDPKVINFLLVRWQSSQSDKIRMLLECINELAPDSLFLEVQSSYLTAIRSILINGNDYDYCFSLLRRVSWRSVQPSSKIPTEHIISWLINLPLINFFECLTLIACYSERAKQKTASEMADCLVANPSPVNKAIIAYCLPNIFFVDKTMAASMANTVLDNVWNGVNISYTLLAIQGGLGIRHIQLLIDRDDLHTYFAIESENYDIINPQRRLYALALHYFFDTGLGGKAALVPAHHSNYHLLSVCLDVFVGIDSPSEMQTERFETLISNFIQNADLSKRAEYDQLIRKASMVMVRLDTSMPIIWNLIFLLFQKFDHFFSDESVALIEKFKRRDRPNVSKLIKLYIESYDKYRTYIESLKNVLFAIKDDNSYEQLYGELRNFLLTKNPYLGDEIKDI